MTTDDAIQVLDWMLTAVCLQVSFDNGSCSLDDAIAGRFGDLFYQAPITYAVVISLIRAGIPGEGLTSFQGPPLADNAAVITLAASTLW